MRAIWCAQVVVLALFIVGCQAQKVHLEEGSGAPRIVLEGTRVVIVPALDTPSPVLRISFPESDADIEIEMPEHIGGNSGVTGKRETLYFKTPGAKLPALRGAGSPADWSAG